MPRGSGFTALDAASKQFARRILADSDDSDDDKDGQPGGGRGRLEGAASSGKGDNAGRAHAIKTGHASARVKSASRESPLSSPKVVIAQNRGSLSPTSAKSAGLSGLSHSQQSSNLGSSLRRSGNLGRDAGETFPGQNLSGSPMSNAGRKSSPLTSARSSVERWQEVTGVRQNSDHRFLGESGGAPVNERGRGEREQGRRSTSTSPAAASTWDRRWTAELEARIKSSGQRRPPIQYSRDASPSSSDDAEVYLGLRTAGLISQSRALDQSGSVSTALRGLMAQQGIASAPRSSPKAPKGRTAWVVAAAELEQGYTAGEDAPISFAGMHQAMEAGALLRGEGERKVLCGPSLAAVQTAHYIAWCIGGKVQIEPGLADPGAHRHGQLASPRQRRAYHPTVDVSHRPITVEPWGEDTMIEGLPRAVDAAQKIAASVDMGQTVIMVAGPAIATAVAATLASGCSLAGDRGHALRLQHCLALTAPVAPCSVFKAHQAPGEVAWQCNMAPASSHLSSTGAPQAPFELLAAGDPRDWLSLWESLRRLHLLCARGGAGSGGGEAKLRADVALQSMHMARAALPTLLRGRS